MRSKWNPHIFRRWSYIEVCRPLILGMLIASISELPHIGRPTYDICLLYVLGGYGPNDVIDYHQVLNWLLLLLPCIWHTGDFTDRFIFSVKYDHSHKSKRLICIKSVLANFLSAVVCFISTLLGYLAGCFLWGVRGWSLQQIATANLTFGDSLLQALILVCLLYIIITFAISILNLLFCISKGAELLGGVIFFVLLFSPKTSKNAPLLGDVIKAGMLFQTNPFSPTGITFYNALLILLVTLIILLVLYACIYVYKNAVSVHYKMIDQVLKG